MRTSSLPASTRSHRGTPAPGSVRPDWGPARHDPEDPRSRHALRASLDHWDVDGPRPDDN